MSGVGWRREWWRKRRWYGRHLRPLARLALTRELATRRVYARGTVLGEALGMLRSGRLTIGEQSFIEPHVWLTGTGRIAIGEGVYLNRGVMVAAMDLVEIGDHTMVANGAVITDADHVVNDRERPISWQGYVSKGPTRIGDNCWLGANVVVTSGVTIGHRCVIGANSTVTRDIPPYSLAVGSPARVIRSLAREGS